MPAIKVTVVCVHCGTTATYSVGVSNGASQVQCKKCHKSFKVYMRNGEVYEVKEH
ncbi:MAG TPA: hypothetical protein PK668_12605 [Myxococcota bacterium]|nr:hypothetical protein [Myxococcota bacterium]HRY93689.1 hypothetical protein [Myxococcota bacterium]